jgi:hypothetical protein
MDSLLVLTGVSDAAELLAAPVERRPTFVAEDLGGLFEQAQPVPQQNHWRVSDRDGQWELSGDGRRVEALMALCAVAWGVGEVRPIVASGEAAEAALKWLKL